MKGVGNNDIIVDAQERADDSSRITDTLQEKENKNYKMKCIRCLWSRIIKYFLVRKG